MRGSEPEWAQASREMPHLTPVVEPLRERALEALRDWLRLPAGTTISWQDVRAGSPIGEVAVRVQAEGRALELILRDARPGAMWQSDGIQVTCRSADPRDARKDEVMRGWLALLAERFTSGESGDRSIASLREALSAVRTYSRERIDDSVLRHVERTAVCDSGFVAIGFRCNQDCSFCNQGRHWPDPPRDIVFRWVDEFARAKIRLLTISGGEPTLYSWLPELVQHARRQGMQVHLHTNAVRFAQAQYLERLKDAGLSGALVALHGSDAGTTEALTRAPGTHRRAVDGIHNALEAGLWVFLNCCVGEGNVESLTEHARFIVDEFVGPHPDNPVARVEYSQPSDYYDQRQIRRAIAPLDRVEPNLVAAARLLREADVPVDCTGTCGFPPCVLRNEPSLARWRRRASLDPQSYAWRTFADVCERCAASACCFGLMPEYLEVHGTRGVVPYPVLPDVEEPEDHGRDYRRVGD